MSALPQLPASEIKQTFLSTNWACLLTFGQRAARPDLSIISMCVSLDDSFLSVRQVPTPGHWNGFPFLQPFHHVILVLKLLSHLWVIEFMEILRYRLTNLWLPKGKGEEGQIRSLGLTCTHYGKESACSTGDLDLIPGLGRSPGEGNGYPL